MFIYIYIYSFAFIILLIRFLSGLQSEFELYVK
jgi:hypothetical protein